MPPIEQFIRTVKMMEEHQYLTGDPFAEEVTRPSSSDISSELVIPSNKEDESTISSEEEKMPISSYEYQTISLIKSEQDSITLISSNSHHSNLFLSPQTKGSNINIQFAEDQKDFNGEIGLHANSNIATVNLPQSDVPLNLFNNEKSRITFGIDQFKEAVPVSLQKLTISDGGIEFKEVETFSSGKI